ncbi:MAG: HlyD family efflux transporter periplasmic adaptor subunit [Lentisphaerae bacterium]|nr:HlyD family efflux transporter periplasmic adaptor subunit [Lentisphaerota bacterium]
MKVNRKKMRLLLILLILLLIGGGVFVWLKYTSSGQQVSQKLPGLASKENNSEAADTDKTFVVKKGDLVLGFSQPGTVSARKKHQVKHQANTRSTIVWIIEENAKVKKGDVLVRLDTTDLENRIQDGKIELENLEKEQEIAIEAQKLEDSTQAANMKAAEDRVTKADDALRKYLRIERRQKRDSLDLTISNAENKVDDANDTYRNYKANPETDTDEEKQKEYKKKLASAQSTISSAENELENAESSRRLWKKYDNPSRLKALYNEVEQAALNMERVKVAISSSRARTKRNLNNYRLRIRRTKDNLEQNEKFLQQMTIYAPADGIVIYGNPDRPHSNPDIKPGMEVWRGMILMTIPEMSDMIVTMDLPEQYRSKVAIGNRVSITPESMPGTTLTGQIDMIPTLPVNIIFWDSSSPKVYKSTIRFDKQSPILVNGMSVQIEVTTGVIKDTLFVPVEAIFQDKERYYVYMQTSGGSKEVDVKIGQSNDRFVEILDGISEGDVVYLYRPHQGRTPSE